MHERVSVGGIAGEALPARLDELDALYRLTDRLFRALSLDEVYEAALDAILTILGCRRFRPALIPGAVALYVVAGYWFTASTCFANPAVAIARSLTDTFAGIRPVDVPWFIAAEIAGAIVAALLFRCTLRRAMSPQTGTARATR